MSSLPFSAYFRPLLTDPAQRSLVLDPVLVWEAGPDPTVQVSSTKATADAMVPTRAGPLSDRPTPGDPLVFIVKKGAQASNALAHGITFGRTPNNDICIPDESVSRFHGFFHRDEKSDLWTVVDAGSKNGVFAAGVKLEPNRPHYLDAREELIIGSVRLVFLVPETMLAYAQAMIQS